MSHITLYRKYRPATFDQVLGQDHITGPLQKVINTNSPSHAYMFAGSRGTGKTSTARIFARALGVEEVDIHEIDAASQRRVEDMREFITEVGTRPMISPYKVYIFDEVHMLTRESANTFLKTLEEPPSHVIFILCTTDLDKVLDTIISRTQVHIFKQPSIETIAGMLIGGATSEGYTLDNDAAVLIARYAKGAFRDAWGLLEKIISAVDTGTTITESLAHNILQKGGTSVVTMLDYLHTGNLSGLLGLMYEMERSGGEIDGVLETLIHYIRIIILIRFAPAVAGEMVAYMDGTTAALLSEYASEPKNVFNSEMLLRLLQVKNSYGNTHSIMLELAFIDILSKLEQ